MSNKYDANEHIKVLAEINTLLDIANETQAKINTLKKELKKIEKLVKEGKKHGATTFLIDSVNSVWVFTVIPLKPHASAIFE